MRRREPSPEFGTYFAHLMARRGLTIPVLAEKVAIKATFLYAVIRGTRPLPEARIARLADELGLAGAERERFTLEAFLAYSPKVVREAFWRFQGHPAVKPKGRPRPR